jgi:monovalent cation:H+ antiporter-2, CPA2 family
VTTALTPLLVRRGPAAAAWIERVLPRRLQTFEALYGSWIEGLGARTSTRQPGPRSFGPRVRRLVALLTVDSLLLLGVVLATGLFHAAATRELMRTFPELDPAWADHAVLIAASALALPLLFGLGRLSRALAVALAEHSLPLREGVDLGLAPRRMLIVALQVPILLVTGLPLLAATGALAPPLAIGLLAALVLYETWQVWRRAGDLQAHVSAGAQAIVEILAAQGHRAATAPPDEPAPPDELAMIDAVLPGLGTPTAVRVGATSALVGQTLGTSNLRGLTGATVLAIQRGARSIPVPAATDTLEVGDVLALAGSTEAIAAASELLK